MEEKKANKKIEVISGDGKDLNISPVETHIPLSKPKIKEKKEIIIPTEKKVNKKD